MKKILLIVFLLILFGIGYYIYAAFQLVMAMEGANIDIPTIESVTSIEDIVKPYVDHENTRALSIATINKGEIKYYNYGSCSKDDPNPPTTQSVYEIGSITKTFTATVLAQMVKEGKVQLTDPISKFLPKDVWKWTTDTLSITLEELATHTSGLPRLATNARKRQFLSLTNPYKYYSKEDLYDFLRAYSPKLKGERTSEYSNLGFGLLGTILADIDGTSYEEMVANRIFRPLNMSHTFIDRKGKDILKGHNGAGKSTSPWDFQSMAGAGAIRSCTKDMMNYLQAHLYASDNDAYYLTHQPKADFGEKDKIGLGCIIKPTTSGNYSKIFHNGGTYGFLSSMVIDKEQQIGVIVFSNSFQGVDDISFRIMELMEKQNKTLSQLQID